MPYLNPQFILSRYNHAQAGTVELSYNDLGLCDTSVITLYIHRHQLISHNARVVLPCLVRHT
jgi:hypothetical protein